MTKLLITPVEVTELAFSTVENLRDDLINESKIEIAQLRFLKPILGDLYSSIGEAQYTQFVDNYIKTALAYYVKSLVIEELSSPVGTMGAMDRKTTYSASTSDAKQVRLRKKALRDADTLIKNATQYMSENRVLFPDYNSAINPKNRISTQGGIIIETH